MRQDEKGQCAHPEASLIAVAIPNWHNDRDQRAWYGQAGNSEEALHSRWHSMELSSSVQHPRKS